MTGMGKPKHWPPDPAARWVWLGLAVFILVGFLHREILQLLGWMWK